MAGLKACVVFFLFGRCLGRDIPGSLLLDCIDRSVQIAVANKKELDNTGRLKNLQPFGIVQALVYALRHAHLAVQLLDDKETTEILTNELALAEKALLTDPTTHMKYTPMFLEQNLQPQLRAQMHKKALPIDVTGGNYLAATYTPPTWTLASTMEDSVAVLGGEQQMPLLGFGTGIFYKDESDVREAIRYAAAELGYRHFDCAEGYHNEKVVGAGLRDSGVPREELFISSKVSESDSFGTKETPRAVAKQLENLGVEYFDLYMFHGEEDTDKEKKAWRALEKLHAAGTVRALGLSNYDKEGIERVLKFAKVKPVYLQIKFSVYHHGYQHAHEKQQNLALWAAEQGLAVVGYSTLSGWPFILQTVDDSHVRKIAERYGKSPGQLLLRHSLQKGVAVIPTSTDRKRMKENTEIFDFSISGEDMLLLDGLAHFVSGAEDGAPTWIPEIYGIRNLPARTITAAAAAATGRTEL